MMRIFLLRVITILMASVFLYRLLDLQVVNTSYQALSENNAVLEDCRISRARFYL